MSQYKTLDDLIIKAMQAGGSPLLYLPCEMELWRIAEATGRKPLHVLNGRMQALRRAGRIQHDSKLGWKITPNAH